MSTREEIMQKLEEGPLHLYLYIFDNPVGDGSLLHDPIFNKPQNIKELRNMDNKDALRLSTLLLNLESEKEIYCKKISEREEGGVDVLEIEIKSNKNIGINGYKESSRLLLDSSDAFWRKR